MSVTLPYRGVLAPFHRTFTGSLAAGASLAAGTSLSEVVCVAGCARVRAYVTASINGTLKITTVRPVALDGAIDGNGAVSASSVTTHPASAPTDVTVTANTEAEIHMDLYGETYVLVTFAYTATPGATLTYCDVGAV